jgi:hypothetical protein
LCYPNWALEAFIIAGAKQLVYLFIDQHLTNS